MRPAPATEPMPIEQSVLLADFARTCKAAARAVSLYPGTHPTIATSLSRLVASTGRLARAGAVKVGVQRDLLTIDGRSPLRPDASVGELATLLHDRLIGRLIIQPQADAEDWRALLLLLARTPDDLRAGGGIGKAWALTGRAHFQVAEIDYAEVLRERGGSDNPDRIIEYCLRGETSALDSGTIAALLEALGDPARFAKLLEQLQDATGPDATRIAARVAALLRLMRAAIAAARTLGQEEVDRAFGTIAAACASLTPETMLAILERRKGPNPEDADLVSTVVERMTDQSIASFMVRAVAAERGASERLARALESLAPAHDRKKRVVDLAQAEAMGGDLGTDPGFEALWEKVATTVMSYSLMSYSDESYVSAQYAKELSNAKQQATEVERLSDDPPERVQAWTATVSEAAIDHLDLELLLDMLRIEDDLAQWEPIANIAAFEIERRTLIGDITGARALLESLVRETREDGHPALSAPASRFVERVASGPLARHVALHFRTIGATEVDEFNHLCQLIGPNLVRTLADALAREESGIAIRRLGALLVRYGAAGRHAVEQLKNSPNPAVRRTAIALLRRAGGQEALLELASMLGDTDAEVQRQSLHAIVEIGTANAFSVLHRLLLEADTPRETALRELLNMRDDKAVPLFSYVLSRAEPRGKLVAIHLSMIEALGTMKPRSDSIRALQQVLLRGKWWAPFRTAAQRQAAAASLRRLGTPEALAVLEAAVTSGGRGVRRVARAQVAPRREKSRT